MVDSDAYDSCDFAGGTNLGQHIPVDVEIGAEDAGKTLYFGCQIPFHCTSGLMAIAFEVAPVEKKQCSPEKWETQSVRKYLHGKKKKEKKCKWLHKRIKELKKTDPEKSKQFQKKNCKKSTDAAEKVAAKVCSCVCKKDY
eukprot:CAMPEP_0194345752 /NCGR_PEP_ID=MMETSP0171-20130528/105036_1 /TAXON_ID=218684 /ORGANISM="Corethron pennatum, Strain L29A3" /LENGTH=139 /DNA_ID=CAMNT_0039112777 /DNA_START=748 /DNA_END=1167 /DNA_ORIENTATION=-